MHDLSLCDHVRPLSTGSFDGSKYNPEACRLHSQTAPVIGGVDPHMVMEWMRKLGYSDADVHEAQYRMNRKNPVTDAYEQSRRETLFAAANAAALSPCRQPDLSHTGRRGESRRLHDNLFWSIQAR